LKYSAARSGLKDDGLTRSTLLLLLGCSLVAVTTAAGMLAPDGLDTFNPFSASAVKTVVLPTANRDTKTDRLNVSALRLRDSTFEIADAPPIPEPLRLAFAADSPLVTSRALQNAPILIPPSVAPQKPKLVAKPPPQKSYTLLSDAQIAGIKERMKLTPAQEAYWPNVETALRTIAQQLHAKRQLNGSGSNPAIEFGTAELAQLRTAAAPLLSQLREDQKREVRALARIIGLEAVASRI
jgi:hypothetical protein